MAASGLCVLESLYTLNCAVRLLSLLPEGLQAVFEVVVDPGRSATTTSLDVGSGLFVSDVINFRLGLVITLRLAVL